MIAVSNFLGDSAGLLGLFFHFTFYWVFLLCLGESLICLKYVESKFTIYCKSGYFINFFGKEVFYEEILLHTFHVSLVCRVRPLAIVPRLLGYRVQSVRTRNIYSLHDKIYSFVTRFKLVNSKRPDLWRYVVTWIHSYIYDIRSVDVDG